jgi:hypothetical protein
VGIILDASGAANHQKLLNERENWLNRRGSVAEEPVIFGWVEELVRAVCGSAAMRFQPRMAFSVAPAVVGPDRGEQMKKEKYCRALHPYRLSQ